MNEQHKLRLEVSYKASIITIAVAVAIFGFFQLFEMATGFKEWVAEQAQVKALAEQANAKADTTNALINSPQFVQAIQNLVNQQIQAQRK